MRGERECLRASEWERESGRVREKERVWESERMRESVGESVGQRGWERSLWREQALGRE